MYFGEWPKQKPLRHSTAATLIFLLVIVILQPLRVYHYLGKNQPKAPPYYRYDKPYLDFTFTQGDLQPNESLSKVVLKKIPKLYYVSRWHDILRRGLKPDVFRKYMYHKWIVYDTVEYVDDDLGDGESIDELRWQKTFERIEKAFEQNKNIAFLSLKDKNRKHTSKQTQGVSLPVCLESSIPNRPPGCVYGSQPPIHIEKNSLEFQVLDYDVNSISVQTNFSVEKFLVYNDNFHSRWQAFMDGKKVDLFRANIAFKGVWVPAGEHTLKLRYGSVGRYASKWVFDDFVFWRRRGAFMAKRINRKHTPGVCLESKIPNRPPGCVYGRFILQRAVVFFLLLWGLNLIFVNYDQVDSEFKIRTLNFIRPSFEPLIEAAEYRTKMEKKQLKEYVQYYKKIIEYIPGRSDAYGLLGFCYYNAGFYAKAIEYYQQAIELHPPVFWFHYNLGVAYFRSGQFDAAIEAFESAKTKRADLTLRYVRASRGVSADWR